MKTVQGDLLQLAEAGAFDVIVHGCNCRCRMGRGIALTIRQLYPEAYRADCATRAGDRSKHGTFTSADIVRGAARFTIVNAYTQFEWRGERNADYDAIRAAMRAIARTYAGHRIGYPKIGAGLAGGDWSLIASIIDEELAGQDHTYVEFMPAPA